MSNCTPVLPPSDQTTFAAVRADDQDFNVQSLRSNVVLRWEWRPGSTLYLVWQQDRDRTDPIGERVNLGDVFGSVSEPGTNIFLVKASFWLPVG